MKPRSNLLIISLSLFSLVACKRPAETFQTDLSLPVSVMDITMGEIETFINSTGTVMATHESTLLSEMAGKYYLAMNPATGRAYKLGDRVKKDKLIIKIEDEE